MQRVNNKVQTTGYTQGREGQIKSLLENIFRSLKTNSWLVRRQKKHTASSVKHDGGDLGLYSKWLQVTSIMLLQIEAAD